MSPGEGSAFEIIPSASAEASRAEDDERESDKPISSPPLKMDVLANLKVEIGVGRHRYGLAE